MRYRNQSYFFRDGANPGFHEGVADILSLAIGTPSYYKRLGLLGEDVDVTDEETNINILFSMALGRLAFMPFGYLVDKYRWDLFRLVIILKTSSVICKRSICMRVINVN